MKKFLTLIGLVLCLTAIQIKLNAQPNHGFAFRTLWYNYVNPEPAWDNWSDIFDASVGRGAELAYFRKISKNTFLNLPVKIGTAATDRNPNVLSREDLLANLDLNVQHNLFKYGKFLNPYLKLGIGSTYNFDQEQFDFNMPAGLGLNIKLMPDLYLTLGTEYRFSIDNRPGWQHGVGVNAYFGQDDRDKDGVSDGDDKCPDVPGVAALMGCPDKDMDGITDAEDRCPDVAGKTENRGCPDKDGDGVVDIDDKCPDVAGLANLMGCPDKDGDGIADGDDACPDKKGTAAMQGCPDTDGDGIGDNKDKCPTEKGIARLEGCPERDKDGDGVVDAEDSCPDVKGPRATRGCPDRDSDGVADSEDACPDKKGDPAHKGCPDTDKDGTYDNDDRCVDKPGPASNKGCPEIKAEDKKKVELAVKAVQFETGKATLLAKSNKVLDDVADVLNRYPEYSLNINGHTDNVGDDKLNQSLSERRAKTCYDYLVKKGVAASRLASAGYGESRPVASNDTPAGREQNRRTEFDLYIK